MKVYFVGAGPGDPDLLTIKAKALLTKTKCCIYAGSLVSEEIISLLPKDALKYDSSILNLQDMTSIYNEAKLKGFDVVRLHSGDPSIFSAIGEQMRELDNIGIDYEIIPGISSFQAAAAALQVELTQPEVSQTIVLTRSSGRTPVPEEQGLEKLAKTRATLCIFLSVHKIQEVAETLKKDYGNECPAAVVFHASRCSQTIIKGTLSDIADKTKDLGIEKTALIFAGWALSKTFTSSKLYDKEFSHGYRRGSAK